MQWIFWWAISCPDMTQNSVETSSSQWMAPNGSEKSNLDSQGVERPGITTQDEPVDICHSFSYPYEDYTQLQTVHLTFILSYSTIILLSATGNLMVIWTICRNKHMRTVTNYYILNLAVSDFLVSLFVMPLKLLEYTAPCHWHVFHHRSLCSFLYYVLPVFVFASVLTLLAISIERSVTFTLSSEGVRHGCIYPLLWEDPDEHSCRQPRLIQISLFQNPAQF